jgi:hypothetical protein
MGFHSDLFLSNSVENIQKGYQLVTEPWEVFINCLNKQEVWMTIHLEASQKFAWWNNSIDSVGSYS